MEVISLFAERSLTQQFRESGEEMFCFTHMEHWFLPCNVYSCVIEVEIPFETKLNLFETAVLRLLQLSSETPSSLAEKLAFQEEFVVLILSELKDLHMVKADYKLTEIGVNELKKQREKPKEIQKIDIELYFNPGTGNLLPYIRVFPIEGEETITVSFPEIETRRKNKVTFPLGTLGKSQEITGKIIPISHKSRKKPPLKLTKEDISPVLREFNRQSVGEMLSIKQDYEIFTMLKKEQCYFHLQAGIERSDADNIIISDGFLPYLPDILEYFYQVEAENQGILQLIGELKHGAGVQWDSEEGLVRENKKYPKLKGAWTQELIKNPMTEDEKKAQETAINFGVATLYGEIEWGLQYYFEKNPISNESLTTYQKNDKNKNRKILQKVIDQRDLYFKSATLQELLKSKWKNVDLISSFSADTLQKYNKNEPIMTALIPLLLLQWRKGDDVILTKIQRELPYFYTDLCQMTTYRNKSNHGEYVDMSFELFHYFQEMGKNLLGILLPDWEESLTVTATKNHNNTLHNRILTAHSRLYEEVGMACFTCKFTPGMRKNLLKLDQDSQYSDDKQEYIRTLYSLLEQTFQDYLSKVMKSGGHSVNYNKQTVIEDLEEIYQVSLPDSVKTIKLEAFYYAFDGKVKSLGAGVLAFLYWADTELVDFFIEVGGLTLVDEICILRGHGNGGVSILLTKTELIDYRCQVIAVMKGICGE